MSLKDRFPVLQPPNSSTYSTVSCRLFGARPGAHLSTVITSNRYRTTFLSTPHHLFCIVWSHVVYSYQPWFHSCYSRSSIIQCSRTLVLRQQNNASADQKIVLPEIWCSFFCRPTSIYYYDCRSAATTVRQHCITKRCGDLWNGSGLLVLFWPSGNGGGCSALRPTGLSMDYFVTLFKIINLEMMFYI